MVHKAFEVIGEKVFLDRILHDAELEILRKEAEDEFRSEGIKKILDTRRERKEGIFQRHMVIGRLNFIEPLYNVIADLLELNPGLNIDKKINPENPILNVYYEINPKDLIYKNKEGDMHIFEMDVYRVDAKFISDSNSEFRNYVDGLKKAGFKIG